MNVRDKPRISARLSCNGRPRLTCALPDHRTRQGRRRPRKSPAGAVNEEVFSAKNPLVLPVPKRVVYWPDIGQPVNKNPTLDGINLYRHRDDATGNRST